MMTDTVAGTQSSSVIIAMSCGVDSSVAAKLLVDKGFKVSGITLKLAHGGTAHQHGADGGIAPVAAAYRLEFLKGRMNAVVRSWLEDGCRESEKGLLEMLSKAI